MKKRQSPAGLLFLFLAKKTKIEIENNGWLSLRVSPKAERSKPLKS